MAQSWEREVPLSPHGGAHGQTPQNIQSLKAPAWELTHTEAPDSIFPHLPVFAVPGHALVEGAP